MYLRDLGASLLRRWPLVLVCLAATAGLCVFVGQRTPPTYETSASVLLVPPKSQESPESNRYLLLGGMEPAVDVLTRSLNSDATHAAVAQVAPAGAFDVAADGSTSAPIFIVTVTGPTRAGAQETLSAVLDQVPLRLGDLQKGLKIAPAARIVSQLVARERVPRHLVKKEIRLLGGLAAGGLLATCVLVGAADSLLLSRREDDDWYLDDEVPDDEVPDDEVPDDQVPGGAGVRAPRLG